MKTTKRILAMLLAIMLVISVATTAFAAMEGELTGGSITIKNAKPEQTYSAYQILYLESYDADAGNYAYKANSAWAEWLATQTDYIKIDDQGYVTWVEGADVSAFAKQAQAQLEGKTADATATTGAGETTAKMENLNLGYYLVDTTLGTLCALDTTNPNVVMKEKNEAPTITKEVEEDSTNEWGETNDADINQGVNYKATITVKKGAENYIMHDTMSEGLTYVAVTAVKIGETDVAAENYTVTAPGACGCTFEVAFTNEYIASLAVDTEIVVYYAAVLNEDAVVGLPGNPNEVKLQYGDKNHPSYTPVDTTITYTWDMNVIKYTLDGEAEIMLADATFALSIDEASETVLKFHALGENKYAHCADAACKKAHVTEITTDETGSFYMEGLDAGTYYLVETAAPAGYNKLAGAVAIEIVGATTNEENETLEYTTVERKVLNQSGTELPETGGMGTTLFYILGSVLVVAAVVLLVTKRRMNVTE